jgi:hypothetical protein
MKCKECGGSIHGPKVLPLHVCLEKTECNHETQREYSLCPCPDSEEMLPNSDMLRPETGRSIYTDKCVTAFLISIRFFSSAQPINSLTLERFVQ